MITDLVVCKGYFTGKVRWAAATGGQLLHHMESQCDSITIAPDQDDGAIIVDGIENDMHQTIMIFIDCAIN